MGSIPTRSRQGGFGSLATDPDAESQFDPPVPGGHRLHVDGGGEVLEVGRDECISAAQEEQKDAQGDPVLLLLAAGVFEGSELEFLSLARCPRINDETVLRVFENGQWPRLKFLRINDTPVTDNGVRLIDAQRTPALQVLDLQNTDTTPAAIRDLRERLPGCRVLR